MTTGDHHGSQGETDSGISTHFDSQSSSSLEAEITVVGGYDPHHYNHSTSPLSQHRRFSHQPG